MGQASRDYQYETETSEDLYWPNNLQDKFDMLQIKVVEYIPISRSGRGGIESTFLSNIQLANEIDSITGSTTQRQARNPLATIMLPIPNDIKYDDSLNWSSEGVGIVGKLAPALAAAAAAGNGGDVATTLTKLASGGTVELLMKQLSNVPGAPNAETLTQGIGGKIMNPYTEQIFKGIGMREFNFSWKLVPRNAQEQSRIHRIIKYLRHYSLPNYSGSGVLPGSAQPGEPGAKPAQLSDRWLTVPNIFELNWMQAGTHVGIQSLPKIKPCVLKTVSVNYTPDNVWATHINTSSNGLSGPAPVAYELSLNFAETEIITAQDVLNTSGGY